MTEPTGHWSADVVLPALLGSARQVYGGAIRRSLAAAGFDDMPARGSYVLGSVARTGPAGAAGLPTAMGVSKQAVSQLLDVLVTRGYLERAPDPVDRRRLTVALTERGQAAAAASRSAVESVDASLAAAAGADEVAVARRVLATLVELGEDGPEPARHGAG